MFSVWLTISYESRDLIMDDLQQLNVQNTPGMNSQKVVSLWPRVVGFGTMEQRVGGDTGSGVWAVSKDHAKKLPSLLKLWISVGPALALPHSSCLTRLSTLFLSFKEPKLTLNMHKFNVCTTCNMWSWSGFTRIIIFSQR